MTHLDPIGCPSRIQDVLERLPSWWDTSPEGYTYKIVQAFTEEMCEFYDESGNLHLELFVSTATGQRLNDLGAIFKLSRRVNETDASYRIRIMAFFPGFSGGGTIPAIKSTINRMTGVPEGDIDVIEKAPPDMTFTVNVLLDSIEDMQLKDTIRDVVWDIKAAGVYPFFLWTLGGDLLAEHITANDLVNMNPIPLDNAWHWEVSLVDGLNVWW